MPFEKGQKRDYWKGRKMPKNKRNARKRIKEITLELKKEGCSICGYKEHTEILQFHHTNYVIKKFAISECNDMRKLKRELAKCILVCPNCHVWIHYNGEEDALY